MAFLHSYMYLFTSFVLFTLLFTSGRANPVTEDTPLTNLLSKRAISQTLFDEFVRFTQFSNAAYRDTCRRPLGNPLVVQVSGCMRISEH